MPRNLKELCEQIENCRSKEELYRRLDMLLEKKRSSKDGFIEALKRCDKLFETQSHTGELTLFKLEFKGQTTQGNRYVVEKEAHFDLNDELYLNCLKKINFFYRQELENDQHQHPAMFLFKSKSQEYEGRTEQMFYSNQLDRVLSDVKRVLSHRKKCDVNPSDIFTELCSPDYSHDVLREIAKRVKKVFYKCEDNQLSIMQMWDVNHSERVSSNVKVMG